MKWKITLAIVAVIGFVVLGVWFLLSGGENNIIMQTLSERAKEAIYQPVTEVNACQAINAPGAYVLSEDILDANGNCFIINSSNVALDGQAFNIVGDYGDEESIGILISPTNDVTLTNISIMNFQNISGFGIGIMFNETNDSILYANYNYSDLSTNISDGILFSNNVTNIWFTGYGNKNNQIWNMTGVFMLASDHILLGKNTSNFTFYSFSSYGYGLGNMINDKSGTEHVNNMIYESGYGYGRLQFINDTFIRNMTNDYNAVFNLENRLNSLPWFENLVSTNIRFEYNRTDFYKQNFNINMEGIANITFYGNVTGAIDLPAVRKNYSIDNSAIIYSQKGDDNFSIQVDGANFLTQITEAGPCFTATGPGYYTFNKSVYDWEGDCIIVASNDVIINGMDNVMDGDSWGDGDRGILIQGGHSNITIYNFSRIHNFNYGIHSTSNYDARIYNNTFMNNGYHVYSTSPDDFIIRNNYFDLNTVGFRGIYISSGLRNNITNNIIYGASQYGIHLTGTKSSYITDNKLQANARGIYMDSTTFGNVMTNNSFISNTVEDISDGTSGARLNYLKYDTGYGKIEWVYPYYIQQASVDGDLRLGTEVIIGNITATFNHAGITPSYIEDSGTNITFRNVGDRGFTNVSILKDGAWCPQCYNFTALDAQTVIFNTTNWGASSATYTLGEYVGGDTIPPWFTSLPGAQTITYGGGFSYRFDAADDVAIGDWWINDSLFGIQDNGDFAFVVDVNPVKVGYYIINVSVNDTSGNENSTLFELTINKAAGNVNLLLNDNSANLAVNPNDIVNHTGYLLSGQGDINMTRNGTELEFGPSPLQNISNYTYPGTFSINLTYPGNENYTAASEVWTVTVAEPVPPTNVTATTAATCRYNKLGYYNLRLPWMRQEGCV